MKQTYDLVMSNPPVLTSHEEINNGDFVCEENENENGYYFPKKVFTHQIFKGKKVIAGLPNLPTIDFTLLSEEECKHIGWINVEKLSYENNKVKISNTKERDMDEEILISGARIIGFKEGFNTSQSMNSNKFTIDDIITAFHCGRLNQGKDGDTTLEQMIKKLIKPKIFNVELEMIQVNNKPGASYSTITLYKPKIISNSIKVNKIL